MALLRLLSNLGQDQRRIHVKSGMDMNRSIAEVGILKHGTELAHVPRIEMTG